MNPSFPDILIFFRVIPEVLNNRQVVRSIGASIQHLVKQFIPVVGINGKHRFIFGREGTPFQQHRFGLLLQEIPPLFSVQPFFQRVIVPELLIGAFHPPGIQCQKGHFRVKETTMHRFGNPFEPDFMQFVDRFVKGFDRGPVATANENIRRSSIIAILQFFSQFEPGVLLQ